MVVLSHRNMDDFNFLLNAFLNFLQCTGITFGVRIRQLYALKKLSTVNAINKRQQGGRNSSKVT